MTTYPHLRHSSTLPFCLFALALGLSRPAAADQRMNEGATGGPLDADVIVYLNADRVTIETAEGTFELEQHAFEFEFDPNAADEVVLWFVLAEQHEPTTVFVSRDGACAETLWLDADSFAYVVRSSDASSYAFEIASPGQPVPTSPVIVLVPVEDPPSPGE